MRIALIVGDRPRPMDRLKRALGPEYSVFTATGEEVVELLITVPMDVVVINAAEIPTRRALSLVKRVKELQPHSVVVCVASSDAVNEGAEELWRRCDFVLKEPVSGSEMDWALEKASEKRRLLQETTSLKYSTPFPFKEEPLSALASPDLSRLSRGLAKSLSTGFDLDRLMGQLMETVVEMVHPSRVSILVFDDRAGEYRVRANQGFSPKVAQGLRLRADRGLALWLSREGRIIRQSEGKIFDPFLLEVEGELQSLRATVAIPLIARGGLVGILALGQRVTGLPYTEEELQTLFTLANNAAVAIQDIQLHHQLQYQKRYIESILAHMSSGVINIDREERVVIFNHRAEQILGLKASEALYRDLRYLPSPLGDLLFDTLSTGKEYRKHEMEVLPDRLPLEINTYRLYDDQGEPVGSVMVFDDISQQKELEEERIRAERLDVLNQVAGWIAHEIKNPLVSIRTMAELLPHRYADPDFRDHFGAVVEQEVKSLDEMVEKLVSLTDMIEYRYQVGEIRPLLEGCLSRLQEREAMTDREVLIECPPGLPPVRYDQERLEKTFSYFLDYLLRSTPRGAQLTISASLREEGADVGWLELTISSVPDLSPKTLGPLLEVFEANSISDLGLCVVRKIVEDHGGKIQVNRVRKGISVSICLPWAIGSKRSETKGV